MFKKLYNFLLSTQSFNPFGLKPEDHDYKLSGCIEGDNYLIVINKVELWNVQLLKSGGYDEYCYISHMNFRHKPNKFQILRAANKLINKHRNK